MIIFVEKIATISLLRFSHNLRDLKEFLRLIDYLRAFIARYVQLAQSLQTRKTTLTRNITIKELSRKRQTLRIYLYYLTTKKKKAFRDLQIAFVYLIFLTHYDRHRRLYIDLNTSKQ